VKLTPSGAQRGIAAVAVLLLAALVGLAIASRFRDSSSGPKLPARVGNWYQARAAPLRADLEGTTTACGVQLEQETMGIADPVLPCGAKIYLSFGGRRALTQVIDRGPKAPGREFELTRPLADMLGFDGVRRIRWAYAAPAR